MIHVDGEITGRSARSHILNPRNINSTYLDLITDMSVKACVWSGCHLRVCAVVCSDGWPGDGTDRLATAHIVTVAYGGMIDYWLNLL